jgi:hypothetical protein
MQNQIAIPLYGCRSLCAGITSRLGNGFGELMKHGNNYKELSGMKFGRLSVIRFFSKGLLHRSSRLEKVLKLGFLPFTQLYQPDVRKQYPDEWRHLCRRWARPAVMLSANRKGLNYEDVRPI